MSGFYSPRFNRPRVRCPGQEVLFFPVLISSNGSRTDVVLHSLEHLQGSVWTYVRVDLLSVFWGPESIFVLSTFQCLLTVARLQTNTHRPNRTPVKAVTMQLNKTRRHLRLIHLLSLQRATSVNLTPAPNLPCFPSNEVARILRHSARRSTLATSSITTFYTLLPPAPIVRV
ncbi:hypothetical protein R3P38DRAFT_2808209 [Favolaschia claudopus]|uniref:Uncharacterized protein n=1 Tax=Favolaschia claudopus TaxID=2862362 RepID=A0AAV9ZH55_9AGAR